jgi:hypothetical protein
MPSLGGAMAVMSKALESQNVVAQIVSEAGKIMDQTSGANANPASELQTEVSSAITGLGRVIDLLI